MRVAWSEIVGAKETTDVAEVGVEDEEDADDKGGISFDDKGTLSSVPSRKRLPLLILGTQLCSC